MALKTRNKVSAAFSMSSMTDIVFLLLIFFMVTSTLISPNALKLLLPKSSNQTAAKPITTVSIDKNFNFYLETTPVPFSQLEYKLQRKLAREEDPTISLHVDKSVPMEQVVKVMNIAKDNKYKLILATRAK
ncbi:MULTISPECIES: ExbD/TolR family protein [unclassified Marinifilum]|jgi:biopolymer transport protein ExbD|uniref:ExbD/TolR family protein n=1 Tax=unclassified Marinifilum TaxID=2642519 RepID=UPI0022737102|nr:MULTISPECIES: biopolymer transporter ExbD [unclassified Marinifilum]MCY1634266.1 biopolymer transporter ExbD [Marinifilum sp. D737]MDQ2177685.1 biopolymer transporter ExbD [Marinifilum sp. D714]